MDDKELEALQAEEALAITDPEAYAISNPTPREWTMSAQDIAKSIKINPIEALTTKFQREGPEKLNWLETVGAGIWDSIKTGVQDIDEATKVAGISYSSPDMTQDEAERLMQDALYTRHFLRQTRQADTAEKIKYKKTYDFSNALGSVIKYAGLGLATGSPAAIGAIAGVEAAAGMEADLVDRYIEKTGDIEGYSKEERAKDLGIAGAYGVFNGITETMLGVERIAAGALGRYSTLEAMSRLARMEGKITKSAALKALRRLGTSAIEEGGEEFIQSIGEDLANAIAGYGEELFTDASLKKALTSAMYGAIIGGPMGWGLYRYNRKSIVDKINRWNTERGAGLDENKIAEIADQIIEDGKTQMVDEIATRVEIRNQYGQAFDIVKQRIGELIDATGTTPWADQNKSKEEYIQAVAESVTLPAIIQANKAGLPLSEFLEVADMQVLDAAEGKAPILLFQPITNVDELQELLDKQNAIIKEQTDAAKLGTATEGAKESAQRRKAILQYQIRALKRQNARENARRTRKKEEADYITAKDLQPEQTATIDTATQAEAGQDYVLFAGKRIPVEYQVVDLSEIQPSHINGEPNPNYTNIELQNRASRGTTQDVADLREKAANITPERLLRSSTSAEGAPVVNAQGEVIAGNGRAEIIRYAYENPETAATYREALEAAGFKTEGMERPILVRRNTTMTPEEQIAAADISNISETSAFDEASQAKRDSRYLKDSPTDIDFAGKLPMSERRGLMQNNGKWNRRQVRQRYEDALLSWLCGNDTQLFEALVLDRGIPQKVLDVLTANGSLIYETATKYPDLQIREDIYHALQKYQTTTKDNFLEVTQQVEMDGRDVMPENILLWNWLYADTTTNRQFLNNYITKLSTNQEQVAAGEDMFGQTVAPLSKKDALIQAIKTTDEERAQMAASKGREYESLFAEETGEIKNAELAAAVASYQNQFATTAQGQLFQTESTGEQLEQRRGVTLGFYDPELQAIVLGKNWNETTLVHEMHHRYLEKIWGIYQQTIGGTKTVTQEWLDDTRRLFEMLEIDPNQETLTVQQQERFASMVEAYITGLGVDDVNNLGFQTFLNWVPEKYKSILNIGYLDENGEVKNPYLDERSIDFFNKWFASPIAPGLPSAPDAQRLVNVSDANGKIVPSTQKTMNNREKEWGQDSELQNKADAQLWRAIGENTPSDMRAALDGEEVVMKAEAKNLPNDRLLPTATKPTLREKWFKTRQPDARERAAEAARAYVQKNPEHARELAFADPETMTEYDAPVDQGMIIRAVMETVAKGSDEWYILDNNLAIVKSMSGSTLSLSGDLSHQAYLDAKREVEAARELKAAVNYAGTRQGAIEKWNGDIREFIASRVGAIIATTPDSEERKTAIKAFIEEAKTKFSGNTTNAILNQLDLTGYKTKDSRAFIKWAEKQIKQAAHAQIDTKEQAELMKASIAAQVALEGINSTEQKDGKYTRAVQSAKDIRHWQFVKDKMKKAYIGRWGRFGIFMDNLFGSYAPSAMLMSVNTLFFANVPSTAINTAIIRNAARGIGKNKVNTAVTKGEIDRIKQIFNASGMNLAQMEKPTSPSVLHGEKYTNHEQAHWYNFTFDILGKEDNWFRIPTFVDALARIATKNANGDSAKATELFKEYAKLGNKSEEAQVARKQALAVANMAVFTQDGMMASALNHIRSQLNTLSRGMLGLDPNGFGLGNILAPFLKTGANVIEMGLTASLAPVRTLTTGLKVLQGKEIPELKKIALKADWTYFTLTAVAVALLASLSGDDDDWYAEPYQTGRKYDPNKPYDSIRIGNVWVKLDIFGPLEIPLRTAAKMVKDWEDKKMAAISNGLGFGLMEALGETPLVNQFTDSPIDYMTKYPDRWATSFGYNQVNKLVPAQIKSLTRAGSRATGTTLDTTALGKTIDRKFHRNYGLDGERLTTNDLINILSNRIKVKNE